MEIQLDQPSRPISLDDTLSCGQVFRWVRQGGWWLGMVDGVPTRMRQKGELLEVESASLLAESSVARFLRLDDDLDSILRELSRDDLVRKVFADVRGVRIVRQDPWECLVSYILSRNCSIPVIERMLNNMCCRFGDRIEWGGHVYYRFPEPESILGVKPIELVRCSLRYGRRQAFELKKIARLVSDGIIDFDALGRMSYEDARSTLISFDHGIGRKVSDCILLFSLEKLEAFPVDVWVSRAVAQLYHTRLKPELVRRIRCRSRLTAKDYDSISAFGRQLFGRYAGYAQMYLYHWIRLRAGVNLHQTRRQSSG
ncbi:MAG: DNA glycosylase [Candidatus Bathyarchaeia archaeon]